MSMPDPRTPLPRDPAMPYAHILLATDLDGTFLGPDSRPVPRNIQAVERFKAGGGFFTAATGRIHMDLLRIIPDAATLFNAPAIMANGAYLYDFATGASFAETLMEPEAVLAFVRFVRDLVPEVGVRISTSRGFLADSEDQNPFILRDMRGGHRCRNALLIPMSQWPLDGMKLYKMVVRGTPESLVTARRTLENHFGDLFSYTSSSPSFLEVQAGGCTKGTGLAALSAWLENRIGQRPFTLAAGNHENDLPMLEAADEAACPSDALEDIKPFCRYILCPFAEGCIADLIDRL